MSESQRKILRAALAAIVISLLFPPMATYHPMGGIVSWDGFGFLLSSHPRSAIMVSMLFAEWVAIGIVSAILWRLSVDVSMSATQSLISKIDGNPHARSAIRTALDKMKQ